MSITQAIVLGVIQGLTEFLPVSSSAHLYVIPTLLGWTYHGAAFDVALHWGTLLALLLVFGGEWWALARGAISRDGATRAAAWNTGLKLALASIPAVIVGLKLSGPAEEAVRNLALQAATLAIFGVLLYVVDRIAGRTQPEGIPGWGNALVIGLAQSLALIPGVSRSGVTITAGRACGMSRVDAARFSFLLAMPITLGAGVLEFRNMLHGGVPPAALLAGIASAAVVGVIAIRGLLRFLQHAGFAGFMAYRLALAALIVFTILR